MPYHTLCPTRLVHQNEFLSFNCFVMERFFAHVTIITQNYNITKIAQVCNLDETGFAPRKYLFGVHLSHIIREMMKPIAALKFSFSYVHCVSLLLCARGDGLLILVLCLGVFESFHLVVILSTPNSPTYWDLPERRFGNKKQLESHIL